MDKNLEAARRMAQKIKDIFNKEISFKKLPRPKLVEKLPQPKLKKEPAMGVLALLIVLSAIIGGGFGAALTNVYWQKNFFNATTTPIIKENTIIKNNYIPQTTEEEKIIQTVKEATPAVVSIIISKDVPILEKYYIDPFGSDPFFSWPFGEGFKIPQYRKKGTEKREIGGGTGFIISKDGMILTNKHVVLEEDADYTVFLNNGEKYPAKILAKDPFYDIAIIQIDRSETKGEPKTFPTVRLGDSSKLQIGQTVIAIGNALGEFQNTVSVGVVSGLGRNITATGEGMAEELQGIIQTDAAINPGNSGGPLFNLLGEVVGINVARSTSGENIGFSLPINMAKRDIEQVKKTGKIIYPFLGIYYTVITSELSKSQDLPVNYGAWIGRSGTGEKTDSAVVPNSPAEKAGLKRDDILLEFDGKKITSKNPLAKIILQYSPGDKVSLKVLRDGRTLYLNVVLAERED